MSALICFIYNTVYIHVDINVENFRTQRTAFFSIFQDRSLLGGSSWHFGGLICKDIL